MGPVAKTVVILLIGMSMYGTGIAIERFVVFRRGRRRSLEYVAALQPLIGSAERLEEASRLQAEWKDAPMARILGTGLGEFRRGLQELGTASTDPLEVELLMHGVGRSMDRARKREMAALARGLPALATISSSAPFVGLFGTVFGIITAFQQMADPTKGGGGGLATVSAGIAEALLTTAAGLGVAIVAVWLYNYFTTRLDGLGVIMEDAAGELTDRLVHSNRLGRLEGAGPQLGTPGSL